MNPLGRLFPCHVSAVIYFLEKRIMNQEEEKKKKEEGAREKLQRERVCVTCSSGLLQDGQQKLQAACGHLGGAQCGIWHFGGDGLRIHRFPRSKEVGVVHVNLLEERTWCSSGAEACTQAL